MTPLSPQFNAFRQRLDLSGFWEFCFDPDDRGRERGYASGLVAARAEGRRPIAVPGSYNDQLEAGRDYLGPVWYERRFDLPWGWRGQRLFVRFGSVNYHATAWLNGRELGEHEGGHLPFGFEITELVHDANNTLVVRAEGELRPDRVPPGNVPEGGLDAFASLPYPPGSYDFFPYAGIQRPVVLFTLPEKAILDATFTSSFQGTTAHASVAIEGDGAAAVRAKLSGFDDATSAEASFTSGRAALELRLPNARLWNARSPNLYQLELELLDAGRAVDRVALDVGLRTVAVDGDALLLNDEPVYLRGFGRHEDFPIAGRALPPPVVVKDYAMLRWLGANSFRTTHYPYSEDMMDLADRLGFLVIDETPAVGLFFAPAGLEKRLAACKRFTEELVRRDKNHPSVIAWSLANEPHSRRPEAAPFFRELVNLTRALDPTRPITIASYVGEDEQAFELCDFVCVNRYNGWYSHAGRIAEGVAALSSELDRLHRRFGKPIMLTEFGADAVPGIHAEPPELFSEEYQTELISAYVHMLRDKPYVVGEHVWNLCDFKTGQAIQRVGGINYKGVLTRERRPKQAARFLREFWSK